MRITDLLTTSTIAMELNATTKDSALEKLADTLYKANKLNDKTAFLKGIHARESQSTTGIGEGIAIPHAKTDAVKTPAIAFGKSVNGIDFDSLDGQPAHLLFMIAAPAGGAQTHLDALAKLSGILMDESVRAQLLQATTKDEVLSIIDQHDDSAEEVEESAPQGEELILAVTACPTGIAHTYMAADALKNQARKMNIPIKVETNGSSGVKNALTDEENTEGKAIKMAELL